ncbi:MAG: hypothetical protein JWP91_83 [Fibrobacteres bacterium]|nr:hypothetical protein [Fibrobacterota bacterium]
MVTRMLGWAVASWRFYRLRRRMHHFAILLTKARKAGPDLFRYLEALEFRLESQERELQSLRWTLTAEKMADWDHELDKRDWKSRQRQDPDRVNNQKGGGVTE